MAPPRYRRQQSTRLLQRLAEDPARIIIVAGPRQVGKTTLIRDTLPDCKRGSEIFPVEDEDPSQRQADETATIAAKAGRAPDAEWLVERWVAARDRAKGSETGFVLVFDEIQRISRWSEIVKGLWDADRAAGADMHVVLLGSSPLLMWQGLSESLAGRFEMLRLTHWSFLEMYEAFGYSIDDYMFFGGYPGTVRLRARLEESDWRNYVLDSLVRPSIEKDILAMTRIDKPALLKQAFELGCAYSSQILSYTKMLGHLRDAGNTVTLAHYMNVLEKAGLLVGLPKYSGTEHRQRGSSPKLLVLNACLSSVHSGYTQAEAIADRTFWGRQVETVVGAHLYNSGSPGIKLFYWRESPYEVDYVIERGPKLAAIEVKSGVRSGSAPGLVAFKHRYKHAKTLVVGGEGIPLAEFLSHPTEHWLDHGS